MIDSMTSLIMSRSQVGSWNSVVVRLPSSKWLGPLVGTIRDWGENWLSSIEMLGFFGCESVIVFGGWGMVERLFAGKIRMAVPVSVFSMRAGKSLLSNILPQFADQIS